MGAMSQSSSASVCPCMRQALQGSLDALKMGVCLSNRNIGAFIILQCLYNPTDSTFIILQHLQPLPGTSKRGSVCLLVCFQPLWPDDNQSTHSVFMLLMLRVVTVCCHLLSPVLRDKE